MSSLVFVAAGSNIGDRLNNLLTAINYLAESKDISIQTLSSIYETKPLGDTAQNTYLNMVLSLKTSLSPTNLLLLLKDIEQRTGRKERVRWAEREIDLDILLYDGVKIAEEKLTIPHPEMTKRDFVLVPLIEINPYLTEPETNLSYRHYLEIAEERFIIRQVAERLILSGNKFVIRIQ